MTSQNIYCAMSNLDASLIVNSAPSEKACKNIAKIIICRRWIVAVCLLLIICIFPIYNAILDSGNHAPPVISYNTFAEAEKTIGKDILFSFFDNRDLQVKNIDVVFQCDKNGNILERSPMQMETSILDKSKKVSIKGYVLFTVSDTDASYIGGWADQNIVKTINGVDICYCSYPKHNNMVYEQVKFVYDDVVYVLETLNSEVAIEYYVDMLVNKVSE